MQRTVDHRHVRYINKLIVMDKLPCIYFSNNNMQGIIMHKKGKSWNDKMKLAMCELERKIQGESAYHDRRKETWPGQEQVEAWTAERQRQRGCGQYCSCTAQEIPVTKEEKKRQNFIKSVCVQVAKSAAFALATIALIQGVSRHLPDSITEGSFPSTVWRRIRSRWHSVLMRPGGMAGEWNGTEFRSGYIHMRKDCTDGKEFGTV